ncbi:MAG TPA: hypothetical protein VHV08_04560 [Pirellulales bacterium]|jgi:anti-sigma factor RsiW|nr:hypothetical protein [Pirellulales bacterium]
MTNDRPSDIDVLHEELTSYLDGELEPAAVRRVEERLARDPEYRAELQKLERAWGLLDRLPRATVDDAFTRTTMEVVALAALQDADVVRSAEPIRRRRRRVAAVAATLAAGIIGFVVGQRLWPSPNDELLRDLPVLENFDLYYQADNLDFLHALDHEGLFVDGDDHG